MSGGEGACISARGEKGSGWRRGAWTPARSLWPALPPRAVLVAGSAARKGPGRPRWRKTLDISPVSPSQEKHSTVWYAQSAGARDLDPLRRFPGDAAPPRLKLVKSGGKQRPQEAETDTAAIETIHLPSPRRAVRLAGLCPHSALAAGRAALPPRDPGQPRHRRRRQRFRQRRGGGRGAGKEE
ncbi:unnamed protein product, partial [Prorocentrum cordatum]